MRIDCLNGYLKVKHIFTVFMLIGRIKACEFTVTYFIGMLLETCRFIFGNYVQNGCSSDFVDTLYLCVLLRKAIIGSY